MTLASKFNDICETVKCILSTELYLAEDDVVLLLTFRDSLLKMLSVHFYICHFLVHSWA